jgi:hypothetical protein
VSQPIAGGVGDRARRTCALKQQWTLETRASDNLE